MLVCWGATLLTRRYFSDIYPRCPRGFLVSRACLSLGRTEIFELRIAVKTQPPSGLAEGGQPSRIYLAAGGTGIATKGPDRCQVVRRWCPNEGGRRPGPNAYSSLYAQQENIYFALYQVAGYNASMPRSRAIYRSLLSFFVWLSPVSLFLALF